jgi:pimeloyl-ACP methyl ester carboxylesterase
MIRKIFKWLAILLLVAVIGIGIWGYAPDVPVKELRAKYANAESEFVDLGNGLTVHLRDEGPKDAPAIILLHGSNASLHTWEEWTKRLKGQYRVIAFDQIGHGLTGPDPKDCYSAACFVDTVNRVAANRELAKFYLGGNSMGGGISHEFAKAHPDKLLGLILVDAGGAPDLTPGKRDLPIGFRIMQMPVINKIATVISPRSVIEESLRNSVSKADYINDKEVDLYWEMLRRPGNRDATLKRFSSRQSSMAAEGKPVPEATRAIPTLIIWGDEDKLIPVAAASWFGEQYRGSTVRIFKGVGHIPMQEIPEESAKAVLDWLAKQPDGQAPITQAPITQAPITQATSR